MSAGTPGEGRHQWIFAQLVVVDEVLIVQGTTKDPLTQEGREAVFDARRVAAASESIPAQLEEVIKQKYVRRFDVRHRYRPAASCVRPSIPTALRGKSELMKLLEERLKVPIVLDLLRRSGFRPVCEQAGLEEFIKGRDDVLDFRTRLRLLKRQGVYQNALVRDGAGPPFEFGEVSMRVGEGAKDRGVSISPCGQREGSRKVAFNTSIFSCSQITDF